MPALDILFLTAHLPVLGLHGGGMRMYYNLKILAERHRITLLSFLEDEREREYLPQLERLGIRIKTVLRRASPARHLLVPKPREHDEYHSREMAVLVRQTLGGQHFDVIQAEYLQMGQHVPGPLPLFKILTEHEVTYANTYMDFKGESRFWGRAKKFYDWMVQLNYEVEICRNFDRVVCMTDEDQALLSKFVSPTKLRTIHIGVDTAYFNPAESISAKPRPKRVLFVGNYRHTPNRDAVLHFAQDILPRIHHVIPEAEFCVVGANIHLLDRQILSRTGKVNLIGFVEDVRPCYLDSAVFVAPIRTGNGMRVKLLEAFSMGMAVIASPLALYGFRARPDEYFLSAGSPDEFAAQTIRLLEDPLLQRTLGVNARKTMQQQYDWNVIGYQFLELVEDRHG
jgi:glycosyltransferase involved in cell wall biosynthesis